jgi:hypothetical protein
MSIEDYSRLQKSAVSSDSFQKKSLIVLHPGCHMPRRTKADLLNTSNTSGNQTPTLTPEQRAALLSGNKRKRMSAEQLKDIIKAYKKRSHPDGFEVDNIDELEQQTNIEPEDLEPGQMEELTSMYKDGTTRATPEPPKRNSAATKKVEPEPEPPKAINSFETFQAAKANRPQHDPHAKCAGGANHKKVVTRKNKMNQPLCSACNMKLRYNFGPDYGLTLDDPVAELQLLADQKDSNNDLKKADALVFKLVGLAREWYLDKENRGHLYAAFQNILDEMPGAKTMLLNTNRRGEDDEI